MVKSLIVHENGLRGQQTDTISFPDQAQEHQLNVHPEDLIMKYERLNIFLG